jgi:hypothetical protein
MHHEGDDTLSTTHTGLFGRKDMMQCFYLERTEDVSGVSGTGRVAEGVQLPSGRVVIEWLTSSYHSIGIYESMCALLAIHGHNGATNVVFVDETEKLMK